MGCFGLSITDSEEISPKSGLSLKEVMPGSSNITSLLISNVIKYYTSIGGIKNVLGFFNCNRGLRVNSRQRMRCLSVSETGSV